MDGDTPNHKKTSQEFIPVAFRVPEDRKHLMKAAASQKGIFLSEWLRRATEKELKRQMGTNEPR